MWLWTPGAAGIVTSTRVQDRIERTSYKVVSFNSLVNPGIHSVFTHLVDFTLGVLDLACLACGVLSNSDPLSQTHHKCYRYVCIRSSPLLHETDFYLL